MLIDHLYRSNANTASCLQQLLDAYRTNLAHRFDCGLTGALTCTRDEAEQTGLLQCTTDDMNNDQYLNIIDMIEKPSMNVDSDRFQSSQFQNRFICQASIDILPTSIFGHLEMHEHEKQISDELGLLIKL
jgi:UTP-glucose-1-phosphate uridylyltransferase